MEDQKKIEFYRYLKELYPNLKDTTIMLDVQQTIRNIIGV